VSRVLKLCESAVSLRSRDVATRRLQGHPDAMLGEVRAMDRVVAPPRPVIVPEVMIRVCRIKPNGQ